MSACRPPGTRHLSRVDPFGDHRPRFTARIELIVVGQARAGRVDEIDPEATKVLDHLDHPLGDARVSPPGMDGG